MFLQTVIEAVINFCFKSLMKTATDCCRTEQQIHAERVAQQCLHENCLQMIQKKQWLSKFELSADIMSGERVGPKDSFIGEIIC